MSDIGIWIFLISLGILAVFFGGALLIGALSIFPVAGVAALVGWLIGGSAGAIVGLIIAGAVGLMVLNHHR